MKPASRRIRNALTAVLVWGMIFLGSGAHAQGFARTVYVQGLIGGAQFSEDALTFQRTASSDSATTSENDLSTMPYFGLAVQYPLGTGKDTWGLDGSLLIGLRSDDKRVVATNNQVAISVDSELWITDLAAGLYLAHTFKGWRAYVAAGPVMLFGEYNDDTDEDDLTVAPTLRTSSTNSESEFGLGVYGRGGIEYQIGATEYVGLCVRGMKANLTFDSAPTASSELSAIQAFMTFSKYF